jgi:hypothetical protein
MWIINVRPAPLLKPQLLANAAATSAMCALRGWHETVVVGYAQPALTVLKTVGAARRTADPYSLMLRRRAVPALEEIVAGYAEGLTARIDTPYRVGSDGFR